MPIFTPVNILLVAEAFEAEVEPIEPVGGGIDAFLLKFEALGVQVTPRQMADLVRGALIVWGMDDMAADKLLEDYEAYPSEDWPDEEEGDAKAAA